MTAILIHQVLKVVRSLSLKASLISGRHASASVAQARAQLRHREHRRGILKMVMPTFLMLSLLTTTPAIARRRVRFSGRGLPPGARYNGVILSRLELRSCVQLERKINEELDALEIEETKLKAAEAHVDVSSQRSVEEYNSRVSTFNGAGDSVNIQIGTFNKECANRAYYVTDMRAVVAELRVRN